MVLGDLVNQLTWLQQQEVDIAVQGCFTAC